MQKLSTATLSLLDEFVQVFVYLLVQGARCATGIHELLQNMTQTDEREWAKPNKDSKNQEKKLKYVQKNQESTYKVKASFQNFLVHGFFAIGPRVRLKSRWAQVSGGEFLQIASKRTSHGQGVGGNAGGNAAE